MVEYRILLYFSKEYWTYFDRELCYFLNSLIILKFIFKFFCFLFCIFFFLLFYCLSFKDRSRVAFPPWHRKLKKTGSRSVLVQMIYPNMLDKSCRKKEIWSQNPGRKYYKECCNELTYFIKKCFLNFFFWQDSVEDVMLRDNLNNSLSAEF